MEKDAIKNLLELAQRRRSVRAFKPRDVPDEYIEKILEVARWAPSGANNQPWEFIVIRDKDTRQKIIERYEEQLATKRRIEQTREKEMRFPLPSTAGFKDAPVFIAVLGDPRLEKGIPLRNQKEKGPQNYYSSLASVVLLIHLAASALGLGSQYVSDANAPFLEAMIKDLLGIPEPYDIYELIPVGYPQSTPSPPFRRQLNEMTHHEKFDKRKFRGDEEIRTFIIEKLRVRS
jgi:5,6-dimethylbenzimidazole synthase